MSNARITQLQAMPIIGDAHHDSERFRLAHEIAMDESEDMTHRITALQEIDRTMGEPHQTITATDVEKYRADLTV